ncbi:DUF2934 domain-containing protein [Methylotenera sp.]|uniref:DUF2934 domain-containing protein n=1 Tax=Methylotenera sp. TaxID=2051956 RepID=UPI002489E67E|nr:DUF2934 domain-containing protein [Methylotenera sp.]MDI1298798.1 DUF2934 domain-containing protein [Methylotenera sp.]
MEISTVTQLLTKNHIPVFGIESKAKPRSEAKSKKASNITSKVLVAESAYYKAEARGFESGHELEDWLAAEAEVAQ